MADNLNEKFFEEQTPSSLIKAKIVSEYFPKYSNIILKYPQYKVGYVDLFSGPGVYKDGNYSTPILVAKNCAKMPKLLDNVWLIYNDNVHCKTLEANFNEHLAGVSFKHKPVFRDKTVGDSVEIDKFLTKKDVDEKGKNKLPAVLFIDPFGYKGVNTKILAEFLKLWGNEIFIFLNTKKINWATQIGKFDTLMNELFPTTINTIRTDRQYKLSVTDRLNLIIENLAEEYKRVLNSNIYHTAFRFQEEDSEATSHFILHLTKNKRGFDLIKQIYDEFDNVGATLDSFGTYTFDAKKLDKNENMMFNFEDENIVILSNILYSKYKGQRVSAYDLYEQTQHNNKYSNRHYREALRKLAADNLLIPTFTDNRNHIKSVLIIKECILQFK